MSTGWCDGASTRCVERARPRQTRLTHSSLGASLLIGFEGTVRSNHNAGVQSRVYWRENLPNLVLGGQAGVGGGPGWWFYCEKQRKKNPPNKSKKKNTLKNKTTLVMILKVTSTRTNNKRIFCYNNCDTVPSTNVGTL